MGRRHRRRHDTDWAPFALMGLFALLRALRGRRGPEFDARGVDSPFKPIATIVALVGAFVGLGVLLTVLSAIAALGSGGALTVACGVPLMLLGFIVWMISRSKPPQAVTESDPWTIDGTASEVNQGAPVEASAGALGQGSGHPRRPRSPRGMRPLTRRPRARQARRRPDPSRYPSGRRVRLRSTASGPSHTGARSRAWSRCGGRAPSPSA